MQVNSTSKLYFPLKFQRGPIAWDLIKRLTNDLEKFTRDFVDQLMLRIAPGVTFGYLPAPSEVEVTRQVIGQGGKFLILTTERSRAAFIYHDRKTNNFVFWGDKTSVVKAMYTVVHRIRMCVSRCEAQEFARSEETERLEGLEGLEGLAGLAGLEEEMERAELTDNGSEESEGSEESKESNGSDGGGSKKIRNLNHKCFVCDEPCREKCGQCTKVPYCSTKCQAIDWQEHKLICVD